MGCNCKNKVNPKYDNGNGNTNGKTSILQSILTAILQFAFGLFATTVFIVAIIPLIVYIIFSLCTGHPMVFRIPNFTKWLKK